MCEEELGAEDPLFGAHDSRISDAVLMDKVRDGTPKPRFERYRLDGTGPIPISAVEPCIRFIPQDESLSKEERLQNVVREFTGQALQGITVVLIGSETQLLTQGIFKVDGALEMLTLRPPFSDERAFSLQDFRGVIRGAEFRRKVPKLQHVSPVCLGMEFHYDRYGNSSPQPECLHFESTAARNEFCMCLKALKLCSDTLRNNPAALREASKVDNEFGHLPTPGAGGAVSRRRITL
jgi:hypothetical protein